MKKAEQFKKIIKIDEGYIIETNSIYFKLVFLTNNIFRIRASINNKFPEESYILTKTAWEDRFDDFLGEERKKIKPLNLEYKEDKNKLLFISKNLKLEVIKNPFHFKIYDHENNLIYSDLKGKAYFLNEKNQFYHYSKIDEYNDYFYGFGEQTGTLNKKYEKINLNPKDAYMYDAEKTNPMYKHIPFYLKLNRRSKKAFGIFYNNTYESEFNLAQERNNYYDRYSYFMAEGGDIDWFFINGPKIKDVVKRYTDLTGKTTLPPLSTLGYIGSTMYYAELEENCDDAILTFIDKNKKEGIPIDFFHLSSGYTVRNNGKRYVYTWNKKRFKKPENFIEEMNDKGTPISPNVKPGILKDHPHYDNYEANNAFIKMKDGSPYVDYWWGGLGSFIDFSSKSGRKIWKQKMNENLLEYGIKSIWNDNCEFEISDENAICDFDGKKIKAKAIKSVLPNLMAKVAYDNLKEKYPNRRPFVVNRSGFSGIQQYASTWAGDNYTEWKTIKYNIATVLGMGLSGVANNGCDIGGFGGPHPEKELFLRWVQNGIFMPRFSIHSSNNDNTVTEPWMYPSIKEYIKKAILLRYSFIPYFYSLFYNASKIGEPILRPLFYEFQNDINVYDESFNFMFGSSLLVANIYEKDQKIKEIYLPEGADWYDWNSRKKHKGGTLVKYNVDIDSIPMFIKSGAIIPRTKDLKDLHNDEISSYEIIIQPDNKNNFILYEDDGVSNDNENGFFLKNYISVIPGDCVEINFNKEGKYVSKVKEIVLDIINTERGAYWVTVNDNQIKQFLDYDKWNKSEEGWYYNAESKSTLVKLKNRVEDFKVKISFEPFDLIGM